MASLRFVAVTATIYLLGFLLSQASAGGGGGDDGGKKVVIHVPYKIHTIHHTHTIYKHVGGGHKGGGDDQEYYKVIGYSGDIDKGSEVHSSVGGGYDGGYGGSGGHGGWQASGHGGY